MRLRRRCAAVAALLIGGALLAPQPAVSQEITPALRRACLPDYRMLCRGIRPGDGRILDCFRAHKQQLMPNCVQALQSAGIPG